MKWTTGRNTSLPEDQRAFLERDRDGRWHVYRTGNDGRLMEGFPKLRDEPFETVEAAQEWVEKNVEPHVTKQDILQVLASDPDTRIVWADTGEADSLHPWIGRILEANGIKSAFVSDRSMMGDFIPFDTEARHAVVVRRLGMNFALDEYVVDVARRLRDQES